MRSDRLSLAGVGADGPPHIGLHMGTGQESKGGDGAAYVIARWRVRLRASDREGLITTVYR